MNENFILFINSVVTILFTGFVGWRVCLRLQHMKDGGQASVSSMVLIGGIFVYCCAAFAVRGAGFYVDTFKPLPAFCSMGGFWLAAMCTWIPLTTSFLFLAVMWRSGVAELRSEDPTLEVTDEGSDMAVGMEDVPSSSGLWSNPLSQ